MEKDFDAWNDTKKRLDVKEVRAFCYPRDIWWASIGLNIGSEEDGKNDLFERPVLVIKVFNMRMVRIIPLTSQSKDDANFVPIDSENIVGSAILSQMKTLSTKRLTRKLGKLGDIEFLAIIDRLKATLI